jgi:hypothetical protein
MNMEQLVELVLEGETEVLKQNQPHCRFVHRKSYMAGTWIEPAAVGRRLLTA